MRYELTETYKEGSKVKRYKCFRGMLGHIYWLIFDKSKAGKEVPIFTIVVLS